jgi:hypothetical protein
MLLYPPQKELKHLGTHLDRRLTWAKYIKTKRKQLNLKAKQTNWLLEKINTINTKQTVPIQSSTQTHMDL